MKAPPSHSHPQVQLYFSAQNLRDRDTFSKNDPFLKLSMQLHSYGNLEDVGTTETLPNTNHPEWKNKIIVPYVFEINQPMVVEIYDRDLSSKSQFIGKAYTNMGKVMGAHNKTMTLELSDYKGGAAGKVTIRTQIVEQSSYTLTMKWKGEKIANMDMLFFGKSDPFLKFLKIRNDNTYVEIGRTSVLMNNSHPDWPPISLPANRLFDLNNPVASFRVQCWDYEENGNHQFIGQYSISSSDLKNKSKPIKCELRNTDIKKPGKLELEWFKMVATPTFLDYLRGGLQLNLVVGIDFTGSNGLATSAKSLHYIAKPPTQYQQVMAAVWSVVQNYDSDQKIPAFGFGAIPHFQTINKHQVDHCFPINDNPASPELQGFSNLIAAYENAVRRMEFSGPTFFCPLLGQAFRNAQRLTHSLSYQILLILTDGEIHDMDGTIETIIKNANLPMSIIIVGIGNDNFEQMVKLDGDNGLVSKTGSKCPRDIVQFVAFNKFKGNAGEMAAELLKEIPPQVSQYFMMMGKMPIGPNPPS